ncbi:hypothetical protein [Photobacterium iliopiscarium]|uniref:hypothetical protein n=1 Tax=Photobacterium iliopiscarium TaxID=56192 RepID=UPI001E50391E|nr:hypothetical protein [Photobacterium iliopiscarium]MCD9489183.1 hypothetical protein [Photobacterium iliopiscarium]MCF2245857.1 hypothetical protein [Photobacterium iliopiscarium]
MHSSDAIEIAKLGANIEISRDSSLHPSDAIEIVKIVSQQSNNITIKKQYHSSDLIEMVKIGRGKVTIEI